MNLILCCGNDTLRQRWFSALHDLFTTYEAPTLQDLRIFVGQRVVFDLLLVHASLVDRESVAYIRDRLPACKLFILSDRPDDDEGLAYLHLGAVGYANSYISQEAVARGGAGRCRRLSLDQPAAAAAADRGYGFTPGSATRWGPERFPAFRARRAFQARTADCPVSRPRAYPTYK